MIELSEEQGQAVRGKPSEPVRLLDPATRQTYVLIPSELYDRLKTVLADDGWNEGAYAAAMEVFARDGWDDPRMDVYDSLDPRRKP